MRSLFRWLICRSRSQQDTTSHRVTVLNCNTGKQTELIGKPVKKLPYLTVVHLGLHHTLHVLLLHGGRDPKTVAHAQELRPAFRVRHLHRAVQYNRPRVQLEPKHYGHWGFDTRHQGRHRWLLKVCFNKNNNMKLPLIDDCASLEEHKNNSPSIVV